MNHFEVIRVQDALSSPFSRMAKYIRRDIGKMTQAAAAGGFLMLAACQPNEQGQGDGSSTATDSSGPITGDLVTSADEQDPSATSQGLTEGLDTDQELDTASGNTEGSDSAEPDSTAGEGNADQDGDGFTVNAGDCDDFNPNVRPLSPGVNQITQTITICPGTYAGSQIVIDEGIYGGQVQFVVSGQWNGQVAILEMEPGSSEPAVRINNSNNITVANLDIFQRPQGVAAVAIQDSSQLSLSGVNIYGAPLDKNGLDYRPALSITDGADITVDQCQLIGPGMRAVFEEVSGAVFSQSVIDNEGQGLILYPPVTFQNSPHAIVTGITTEGGGFSALQAPDINVENSTFNNGPFGISLIEAPDALIEGNEAHVNTVGLFVGEGNQGLLLTENNFSDNIACVVPAEIQDDPEVWVNNQCN